MESRPFALGLRMTLILCLLAAFAHGAGSKPVADVSRAVEEVVKTGSFDLAVVNDVHKLPANDRAPLAARLAESPNPAMRRQAIIILQDCPPAVAIVTMRRLMNDTDADVRNAAVLYLAADAKDAGARTLVLKDAAAADPGVAARAVTALGRLSGPDVGNLLAKLLGEKSTPQPVRVAAILAAGGARATECRDALCALLKDPALRTAYPGDTARLCDLAASALERIYQINYTGVKDVYFTGPIAKRDEGIRLWEQWGAKSGTTTGGTSREDYIGGVIEESLKQLESAKDTAGREAAKAKLATAVQTTFCLGSLPGVDRVVSPSVRDLWKIMRVSGEGRWPGLLNSWQRLQTDFEAAFVPEQKALASAPDVQALAFIRFAEAKTWFPRIWVWWLCRDFRDLWRDSKLLAEVGQISNRLEAGFQQERMQVVLHGRMAVLEPRLPQTPAPGPGQLVPVGATALDNKISREPSNWAVHRAIVEFCKGPGPHREAYPLFRDHSKLYPGNEWTFVANAAYLLRVNNDPGRALEFANNALLLNPGNAKAYAIRGMIGVFVEGGEAQAFQDLTQAIKLDPASLGHEPETLRAVTFVVKRSLASGKRADAKTYLGQLGDLTVLGADRPVRDAPEFKALLQEVNRP